MPRYKEVKSLYELCLITFNKALISYIDNVSPEIRASAPHVEIKNCVLDNVNPIISESLLSNLEELNLQNDSQKFLIIKLYRNDYIKEFNPKFKLPNQPGFYENYLRGLNKLVVLNLTKVCTDEVLEIVGENCPLLEVIYIISKTESITSKCKKNLNALKLYFFVSDYGLKQLHKCKYLKKIYMDKIIRTSCGGRRISHGGLVSLLNALPNIRYISYLDMGRVLEEWEQTNGGILNLTHIHDNHITQDHINTFSAICPHLQTLCLAISCVGDVPQVAEGCMDGLTASNLTLKNLVLKGFPFNSSLERFLHLKGEHLTTLSLEHEDSLTAKSLFVIGLSCRNLEHLAVKLLIPYNFDYEDFQCPFKCFTSLKTLKLFGLKWQPHVIFKLCIYNAQHLKSLVLYNKYYSEPLDDVFELLSSKNALSNLESLSLLDGFSLSLKTMINFVVGCKKLREITFKKDCAHYYYKAFEDLIEEHNYDLTLKTDNLDSYGYCLCQNYFIM